MTLAAIAARAVLVLAPTLSQGRADELGQAVAHAVERAHDRLPFEGPGRREASAALLVAVAWHESTFRREVETCRVTGPAGELGLWQLGHGPACPSLEASARQALVRLAFSRSAGLEPMLAVYRGASRAPERLATLERVALALGLELEGTWAR